MLIAIVHSYKIVLSNNQLQNTQQAKRGLLSKTRVNKYALDVEQVLLQDLLISLDSR